MQAIVYVSRAFRAWDEDELSRLVVGAAEKNRQFGISGYLYADADRFAQYIEGPAPQLLRLMGNIRRDNRHQVLREVMRPLPGLRRFSDWPMRRLDRANLGQGCMEPLLCDQLLLRSLWSENGRWHNGMWRLVERLASSIRITGPQGSAP